MSHWESWKSLFACRLCWQIAVIVFLLILAVESVILVPSSQRFENEQLVLRTNHAIIAIEPTLAAADYGSNAAALARGLDNAVGRYGITGVMVRDPSASRMAMAGDTQGLAEQLSRATPMAANPTRSADGTRLDLSWPTEQGLTVAARVDATQVAREVWDYSLRVAGLVGIIVLVVTVGTMLVLHRLVLRPLLLLRSSARAAAADPDHADRHVIQGQRRDEIGELMAAHDALLEQVAASKQRDRESAEQQAHFISNHDPLTGLPNRGALLQYLKRQDGSGHDAVASVTLHLVNILQFRVLNASLGTELCDQLLRQFAIRLTRSVRPSDLVAHLGADRFAVARCCDAFDAGRTAEFAERLLADISQGYDLHGAPALSPTVRIGISSGRPGELDGNTLINDAELALARIQSEDSAGYEFYTASFGQEARARQALRRDMQRGIEVGEFFPVLQPKIAFDSFGATRLAGAEVLVRWQHPQRGLVNPSEFIPLAEASGLIVPLGEQVMDAACALMRRWLDLHGWSPKLAVNLSARQFALPDLEQRLARALAAARLTPDMLEIEITESAAMRNVEQTASVLANLRTLGVKVSIDDFGTGYSSLAYLRRFAVDAIKIDKSFVDDIGADPNAQAVCDAILRLGQALGCKVIAEGVETEVQVGYLRRQGCDEIQGYYFSAPVTATQFEARWLAATPGDLKTDAPLNSADRPARRSPVGRIDSMAWAGQSTSVEA